ncbi:hypothetical protein, partial [Mesorhizobium sp.]|uniref:hypothetical protein n=1 Tax=Mesorhizobium sp. TaxID=1871066 RepID=UPI0025E6E6EC
YHRRITRRYWEVPWRTAYACMKSQIQICRKSNAADGTVSLIVDRVAARMQNAGQAKLSAEDERGVV